MAPEDSSCLVIARRYIRSSEVRNKKGSILTRLLSEYSEGDRLKIVLCAKKKVLRNKKDGGKFLTMELADKSASFDAVAWDQAEALASRFKVGDFIEIEASLANYQGKNQLTVTGLKTIDAASVDAADFLPCVDRDIDELWAELRQAIDSIGNRWLSQLLNRIFGDEKISATFRSAPGAMNLHHNYVGGLLEHTVAVAHLCEAISKLYPDVDHDLLVAGGILHDIGKMEEYKLGGHIDMTDEGQLLGHIVLGDALVSRFIAAIVDFPPKLANRVRHVIISHHGQLEWGSPKTPATIEALLIHHVENIDAKVAGYRSIVATGDDGRWSAYHPALRQSFLIEPAEPDDLIAASPSAQIRPPLQPPQQPVRNQMAEESGQVAGDDKREDDNDDGGDEPVQESLGLI